MGVKMIKTLLFVMGVLFFPIRLLAEPISWWNSNYQYRQQLTIKADSSTIPQGYTIKSTFNISKEKVKEDLRDLRVVYYNGMEYIEIDRIVQTQNEMWFKVQKEILPHKEDRDYYIYYGYKDEWRKPPANASNIFDVLEGEVSGAFRYKEGKFNNGVFIEEGTINLLNNPSFEVKADLEEWVIWADKGELSESIFRFRKKSLMFGKDAESGGCHVFQDIDLPEGTYTLSAWTNIFQKGTLTWDSIRIWNAAKDDILAYAHFDVSKVGEWQHVSTTTKSSMGKISVATGSDTANAIIYLDGMQLEARPYATSFCDGDLGKGYSWEESFTAPHSASRRDVTTLSYPNFINPGQGSISFWVKSSLENNIWNDNHPHYLFDEGHLTIYKDNSNNLIFTDGVNSTSGTPVNELEKSDFHHIVALWGEEKGLRIYMANSKRAGKNYNFKTFQPNSHMYFGSSSDGKNQVNAVISDIAVFDRILTEEEIVSISQGKQVIIYPTEAIFVANFPDNTTTAYIHRNETAPPELILSGEEKREK